MKVLLFLAGCLFVVQSFTIPDNDIEEWKAYKMKYKKSYSEEEDKFRMKVFMDNKQKIKEHNARYKKGEVTFTLGVNQFTDMLHSEFRETYLSNIWTETFNRTQDSIFTLPDNINIPDEVDWTKKGAVTRVKDQGNCGSFWAFSATGAVESQQFLKRGKLVSLSEQNLVDCTRAYGNWGCTAGLPHRSFDYILKNKGIDTEESYPYTAKEQSCNFNPDTIGATIDGYKIIPRWNETALKIAVATIGPISVLIDAWSHKFMNYKGGVYFNDNCKINLLNHAFLVVGYGTDQESGKKYWLAKNSWSEDWGEKGYMRVARDAGNMCGIATFSSYPEIKDGE